MTQPFTIFIIDDEPMMLDLLVAILAADHAVEVFTCAEACLRRLAAQPPDLFLMDVGLPGMDGYALCRTIKDNPDWAAIPVTFISGHDTIEAKLRGYEAGGEDFIVKPIEADELLSKVQIARRIAEEHRQLREQARYAERTAMSAMTSMGELGIVIDFLRKTFACTTGRELAAAILAVLEQYGLHGAVQVRLGGIADSVSPHGSNLPLEVAVLDYVRGLGRIFEAKERAAFNYGGITVLVNDMPRADAECCGRIRDNLAILAEGADGRRQAIEIEQTNSRTQTGIRNALAKLHAALDGVRSGHRSEHRQIAQLMVEIEENMVKSFVRLGLTESQENAQIDLVKHYVDRIGATLRFGHAVTEQLEHLAAELRQLALP
ncbi:MAG: response regulator [Rhodocyclaceae bacterium]|nr:response regulator [Rhodocyclaceae bacterium]